MHDLGFGCHARPGATGSGPQTEIRLLAVHEEFRVKAAERVPEITADQEEAALHYVDVALVVALPVTIGFGVEDPASGEKFP